jgi:hypothetical protein
MARTRSEIEADFRAQQPFDSTATKKVNGESVQLTEAEYEENIARWTDNQLRKELDIDIEQNGGASVKYAEFRREAYGSIGDQLDMQYHDFVNGTTVWQNHIAAVKAKYPKP